MVMKKLDLTCLLEYECKNNTLSKMILMLMLMFNAITHAYATVVLILILTLIVILKSILFDHLSTNKEFGR